jgi:hypothetical protein
MSIDFRAALDSGEPTKTIPTVTVNFLEVLYPDPVKRISFMCKTHNLYVSFSYSDGDSGTSVDSAEVEKKNYFSMTVPDGLDSVCVATTSGTASNVIFVMEVYP